MLDRTTLEKVNQMMLRRGAPIERDNVGYNKPDYNKLSNIWYGATDTDMYEISKRLLKYYDTQLQGLVDFKKEDIEETLEHYEKLTTGRSDLSVTVGFMGKSLETAFVGFKYNTSFMQVVKRHNYTFDRDHKVWKGSSREIVNILNNLKDIGAEVTNAINYVEEKSKLIIEPQGNDISIVQSNNPQKQFNVTPVGEDMLELSFQYNTEILEQIKEISYRKFNWDKKTWTIYKDSATELFRKIQLMDLGYDLTELGKYVIGESEKNKPIKPIKPIKPKLQVKMVKNKDIEFIINYNQKVIDAIKELSFYQYDKDSQKWTIDIREKDKLVDMIKDIIDCTELENIEYKRSPSYRLKDFSKLKRKPYSHQIEAAEFLLDKKMVLLADEMGTGKTLSSILACFSIPAPRVIVCPASLKLNWEKEIRNVDKRAKIKVVNGHTNMTELKLNDWIIINYDILQREYENLTKLNYEVIVFDEAHYLKSIQNNGEPGSKRAEYGIKLTENCEYVFALTGTPITNKPKDIFNILRILDHILSRSFYSFAMKYCDATHNGYGWDFNGVSNEKELNKELQTIMLRRLKKDILELPEKIRKFIPIEADMREYDKLVYEYMSKKYRLAENEHLAYLARMKHVLAKGKIPYTIELAENILENDEQVVIFTNYESVVTQVMNKFGDIATKITGSCSNKERQRAVDQFEKGEKKVIVANIIAGGVGITLVKSNNIIFNDFDWTPANHVQAEDRIHRIGQTRTCNINYLYVSNAEIDEFMANILETKSEYINKIIDGGKGETFNIKKEMIQKLYNKNIEQLKFV